MIGNCLPGVRWMSSSKPPPILVICVHRAAAGSHQPLWMCHTNPKEAPGCNLMGLFFFQPGSCLILDYEFSGAGTPDVWQALECYVITNHIWPVMDPLVMTQHDDTEKSHHETTIGVSIVTDEPNDTVKHPTTFFDAFLSMLQLNLISSKDILLKRKSPKVALESKANTSPCSLAPRQWVSLQNHRPWTARMGGLPQPGKGVVPTSILTIASNLFLTPRLWEVLTHRLFWGSQCWLGGAAGAKGALGAFFNLSRGGIFRQILIWSRFYRRSKVMEAVLAQITRCWNSVHEHSSPSLDAQCCPGWALSILRLQANTCPSLQQAWW